MTTIINTDESNLAYIQFKDGEEIIEWKYLSRSQQLKILDAMIKHYSLFLKFVKDE